MPRRLRRNHTPAFKAKVALAAVRQAFPDSARPRPRRPRMIRCGCGRSSGELTMEKDLLAKALGRGH